VISNYYTIFFTYQGQDYFADCNMRRVLSSEEIISLFIELIFEHQFFDAPIKNIQLCVNHDPVFTCKHFDYREGVFSLIAH